MFTVVPSAALRRGYRGTMVLLYPGPQFLGPTICGNRKIVGLLCTGVFRFWVWRTIISIGAPPKCGSCQSQWHDKILVWELGTMITNSVLVILNCNNSPLLIRCFVSALKTLFGAYEASLGR